MQQYHEHHESEEFKLLRQADGFCLDTFRLIKNTDIFPKNARWLGLYEVTKILNDFHTKVYKANNIAVTSTATKEIRLALIEEAYADIKTLGEKMNFLLRVFEFDVNKLDKWLANKGRMQAIVSAWKNSEISRYKDIG